MIINSEANIEPMPPNERKKALNDAEKRFNEKHKTNRPDASHETIFASERRTLAKLLISIDVPIYYMANGRTMADQEEFAEKENKGGAEWFLKNEESVEQQQSQHKLLFKWSQRNELYESLKERKKDIVHDPIYLTNEGVVRDGNRRLSAMRELLQKDPETYKEYKKIEVVRLPDGDERDLAEWETVNQQREDLKADYSWTNQMRNLYYKINDKKLKFKETEIAAQLSTTSQKITVKDLKIIEAKMHYVDQFLQSLGHKNEWSIVESDEQLWKSGAASLYNLKKDIKEHTRAKSLLYGNAILAINKIKEGRSPYTMTLDVTKKGNSVEIFDNTYKEMFDVKDVPGNAPHKLEKELIELHKDENHEKLNDMITEANEIKKILN